MYKDEKIRRVISFTILMIFVFITMLPLYVLLITSFKSDIQLYNNYFLPDLPIRLNTYVSAFNYTSPFLLNSIIVTVGVAGLSILCSVLAAFGFHRYDFPGRAILYSAFLALMMVPGFMTLAPQFVIARKLNILNTYIVQILPLTGATSILATFLTRTYLEGLPNALFEAAEMEGAGTIMMLYHIVFPLSKPIITIILINNSIAAWNNYIWPLVSANVESVRPIVIAIRQVRVPEYFQFGTRFAAYVITSIPLLVMFAFNTKAFMKGLTSGSIKA